LAALDPERRLLGYLPPMESGPAFEAVRFLKQFGFEEDPFASTNAADEPNLSNYFVEPPYFSTVMGDPRRPQSHVVLAPRGGGKTAQRRMIEEASAGQNILCVTYDAFDLTDRFKLSDATWDYHAEQVARLVVVGILSRLIDDDEAVARLSKTEKKQLGEFVEHFVGSMTEQQFERATKAIKSLPQKAGELLRRFTGPLNMVVGAILTAFTLPAAGVKYEAPGLRGQRRDSLRSDLERLVAIAQTVGFHSVYVLVDRVDEIGLTSTDASKTLQFIQPLATDLPTLELSGVAFKFFLWDLIGEDLRASGGRPDRVPIYTLAWSSADLVEMMSRRLSALSSSRVTRLSDLCCDEVGLDVDLLMASLAGGSPRDLIRMMSRVIAEQTRMSDQATCIGADALWDGIRHFAEERAEELFSRHLPDVRRIGARGQVTFTINQLASDVFRVSAQAARSKVQKWEQTGLISQIGELPNPGNRPMHLYGAVDPRLVIAMLRTVSPEEILGNYLLFCPQCEQLAISDREEIICPHCNYEFTLGDASSLLEVCTR
jgi:hypothetical protein